MKRRQEECRDSIGDGSLLPILDEATGTKLDYGVKIDADQKYGHGFGPELHLKVDQSARQNESGGC